MQLLYYVSDDEFIQRDRKERINMARYNAALIINITSNPIQKSAYFLFNKIIYNFLPRNGKVGRVLDPLLDPVLVHNSGILGMGVAIGVGGYQGVCRMGVSAFLSVDN